MSKVVILGHKDDILGILGETGIIDRGRIVYAQILNEFRDRVRVEINSPGSWVTNRVQIEDYAIFLYTLLYVRTNGRIDDKHAIQQIYMYFAKLIKLNKGITMFPAIMKIPGGDVGEYYDYWWLDNYNNLEIVDALVDNIMYTKVSEVPEYYTIRVQENIESVNIGTGRMRTDFIYLTNRSGQPIENVRIDTDYSRYNTPIDYDKYNTPIYDSGSSKTRNIIIFIIIALIIIGIIVIIIVFVVKPGKGKNK